jgi:hypothetical protein
MVPSTFAKPTTALPWMIEELEGYTSSSSRLARVAPLPKHRGRGPRFQRERSQLGRIRPSIGGARHEPSIRRSIFLSLEAITKKRRVPSAIDLHLFRK